MADNKNLQNVLSTLLSVNTNLWNKLSGIIENGYLYKNDTTSNLDKIISTGADNWLDYNSTSKTLEVKIPVASKNVAGLVKAGDGISVSSDGTISVVAEGVKMDEAGTADVAKSTSGTLTIGGQTFNGSVDVTVDLSNTIELSSVTEIPASATATSPKLLYTPEGQTAIVTSTGIISTSEEITNTISNETSGKIATAKAVMDYVSTAATNVTISSETTSSGTTLYWSVDGNEGSLNIDKEKFASSGSYNETNKEITFTMNDNSTFTVPVADLVHEYTAGAGLTLTDSEFSIVKDTTATTGKDSKFLQIGTNTIGLSGITDAIEAATSAATSGAIELKSVNSIPTSGSAEYAHPTLVYTADGETAIVTSTTVIKTSEETVSEITSDTSADAVVTVAALTSYVNDGLADLLTQVEALRAEIAAK